MKNIIYVAASAVFFLGACQSNSTQETSKAAVISKEAIAIHDEIMPQIGRFDRTAVKIDSLLQTPLDESSKKDLSQLKGNLEEATDHMMTWMKEYAVDSTNISYQEAELVKVKAMKKQFEDVSLESNKKLASFN